MTAREVFNKGWEAGIRAAPENENPFPQGSTAALLWEMGRQGGDTKRRDRENGPVWMRPEKLERP